MTESHQIAFVDAWVRVNPHLCITPEILSVVQEAADKMRETMQPEKKRRIAKERCVNYWNTPWGRMLTDPQNRIEGSREFKTFRRRFRMPAELFLDFFIPRVKAVNLFDLTYQSAIPVEIKCLIALRILGRGHSADDNWDGSGVAESTCTAIFHKFIRGMVKHFFTETVKPPTGDKLAEVMATYARLGYPGAVGSIDCTHIFWGKCPVRLTNLCKGKEKIPSLSFEVVVDHTGCIHSCTEGFVGTCSDKMIVVNDPYAKQVSRGMYKDIEFSLYNKDGSFTTYRGGYFISDCGYTRQWMFQMPLLNVHDPRSVYWSEFLESVRKDVERTFGILKARFVYLAHKVPHHDAETITAAMRTCCILHNWLLHNDRFGRTDWTGMDPDADPVVGEDDADPELNNDVEPGVDRYDAIPAAAAPHTGLGLVPHTEGASVVTYHQYAHKLLQDALITHFEYCYRRGCLVWPRGFSAQQRVIFPIVHGALESNVLYAAPSWYRAMDQQNQYTRSIGKGMYATCAVAANTRMVRFKGEIKPMEVYEQCVLDGKGGYAIKLSAGSVLDCYDTRNVCFASMANSPRSVRTEKDGLPAQASSNCRLVISNSTQGVVYLETTRRIPANIEYFWDYGNEYVYPV